MDQLERANFLVRVDEERCLNCHLCISVCPTKYGNDGSGDVVVLNPDFCVGCGACVAACTHEARYVVDDLDLLLEHLDGGGKAVAIVAPSVAASFPGQHLRLNGFLKSVGIEAVFDVAFGAELAAKSYVELLRRGLPGPLIAQPCPAVVNYIETFQPELLPHLAPVDSPMGHLLKWLRRQHPELDGHKVLAISPCAAKKREFEETGFDVFNVGFTRLAECLESNGHELNSFPETPYDNPLPERAAMFPVPGGLGTTLTRWMPEMAGKIRRIEGVEAVYEYLRQLPEAIDAGMAPTLVDCLNCGAGCNGGPMAVSRRSPLDVAESLTAARCAELAAAATSIETIVNQHWGDGGFDRGYVNRHELVALRQPEEEELRQTLAAMHKHAPEDQYNCSSCGYNSCEGMALAVFNGLNKPENCHFFLAKENERVHFELMEEQRRQAEADLREREENLAATLNAIGDGVIVADKQGKIKKINPVAELMTGWSQSEAEGVDVEEVFRCVDAKTRQPALSPAKKAMTPGRTWGKGDELLVSRGGHEFAVATNAAPVADQKGKSYGYILVFQDVSAESRWRGEMLEANRRLEEAEAAASAAKIEFIAKLERKARIPATTINDVADQLIADGLEGERRQRVELIKSKAGLILTLVEQAAELAKIQEERDTHQ